MLIGFEAALALVAVGLGRLLSVDPFTTLTASAGAVGWGLAGALPMLAAAWGVSKARGTVWEPVFAPILSVVDEVIMPLFAGWPVVDLALAGLCAGIGEELLFRGVVQAAAMESYGAPAGLLAASLVFGLLHYVNVAYAVFAALVGIYLGGLWLATGNLAAPITAHAVYDVAALIYLTRRHDRL